MNELLLPFEHVFHLHLVRSPDLVKHHLPLFRLNNIELICLSYEQMYNIIKSVVLLQMTLSSDGPSALGTLLFVLSNVVFYAIGTKFVEAVFYVYGV